MGTRFRYSARNKGGRGSEQHAAGPGEAQCVVCTGTKLNATKSCLRCETHLEAHLTAPRLKSHKLIHPLDNLQDRMCKKHNETLKLFCKTDQTCVCLICPVFIHKNHECVPLEEEYKGKKAELEKTEAEIQQKIQQRRLKIQEIIQSANLSGDAAQREKADGAQVFTALKQMVEKSQADFFKDVEERQKNTQKQAEGFIKELQQELSELMERAAEVEQLLRSQDHLHLLQSFPSNCTAPPTKDCTQVIHHKSHEGSVVKAVAQLERTISKGVRKLLEVELKRIQQFAVDVTLDPDTAHPNLILSEDEKQVHCGDVRKNLLDNPERFDRCVYVLGKQSFSSGRSYYEIQVKGKTAWTLGVASESLSRKGHITTTPQNGYWTVRLRNESKFLAPDEPPVRLSVKSKPEKVGVFVDYEEGLVSFYDVHTAALIFSFTGCIFTHKLRPLFSPCVTHGGTNSAPLMISAVSHTE
ncbi:E3 ubiquitin-protein ligase TRIM39-like [Genypterus blacodes]|uniref:E3 ubiquitin-protein ligase TRIM39-like n=1 Tax=Genypterus blacodes TaxID=154954 RepID=UPI003F767890